MDGECSWIRPVPAVDLVCSARNSAATFAAFPCSPVPKVTHTVLFGQIPKYEPTKLIFGQIQF